jgi:hypothetical protein
LKSLTLAVMLRLFVGLEGGDFSVLRKQAD